MKADITSIRFVRGKELAERFKYLGEFPEPTTVLAECKLSIRIVLERDEYFSREMALNQWTLHSSVYITESDALKEVLQMAREFIINVNSADEETVKQLFQSLSQPSNSTPSPHS